MYRIYYCLRKLQLYKDIRTLRLYVGGLGRWGRSGESACRGRRVRGGRCAVAGAPRAARRDAQMHRMASWRGPVHLLLSCSIVQSDLAPRPRGPRRPARAILARARGAAFL